MAIELYLCIIIFGCAEKYSDCSLSVDYKSPIFKQDSGEVNLILLTNYHCFRVNVVF